MAGLKYGFWEPLSIRMQIGTIAVVRDLWRRNKFALKKRKRKLTCYTRCLRWIYVAGRLYLSSFFFWGAQPIFLTTRHRPASASYAQPLGSRIYDFSDIASCPHVWISVLFRVSFFFFCACVHERQFCTFRGLHCEEAYIRTLSAIYCLAETLSFRHGIHRWT